MYYDNNWAVVIPLANEATEFPPFVAALVAVLDRLSSGTAYLIVDNVSTDTTLDLCRELAARDSRFITVWAPKNRNVVDAYVEGLRAAYRAGHELVIEMDAGMSHDPSAIPMFLRVLNEGNECAWGSRFISGGSMVNSPLRRKVLSKGGTVLANLLLGSRLHDMTSGFQGFHRGVIAEIIRFPLRSTAHFYQTEVRYLLRYMRACEVPIHYQAPSPRVSRSAIRNAYTTLLYYWWRRVTGRGVSLGARPLLRYGCDVNVSESSR